MNELGWSGSRNPDAMLEFIGARTSERKLRLFAAACCRGIWHLLLPESRQAVEAGERLADGLATPSQAHLFATTARYARAHSEHGSRPNFMAAQHAAERAGPAEPYSPRGRAVVVARAVEAARYAAQALGEPEMEEAERVAQSVLVRHIFGNPFRQYSAPPYWPSAVIQLAEAICDGADAAFALHDALLEAGHPELADHFRADQVHPKGCWVLDMLLGRV